MPLRFNQRELTSTATRPEADFEKQGVLALREDDGYLFHKSERFVERLFRLKGNLLFYFKSKDSFLEVAGIIVLDHCKLCLTTGSRDFTFVIDSEHYEDVRYELAADSKQDMDDWIEKIDSARYETISQKLKQLRIDIVKLSGEDPLPDYPPINFQGPGHESPSLPSILDAYEPTVDKFNQISPKTEICIACTNLSLLQDSLKPVLVVRVLTKISPGYTWSNYCETEFCEEFCEPFFLKTVVFDQKFPSSTKLKFVLCDAKNRMRGVIVGLGQAVCSLQDIHRAPGWRLSLSLIKLESKEEIGCIVLQGWKRSLGKSFDRRQNSIDFIKGYGTRDKSILMQYPRTYIGQVCEQSFHYPTKDGDDVKFQELMGESTIPFNVSCQLLKIYICEEKEAVLELHKLGKLERCWEQVKDQQQNYHFDLVSKFSESLADLGSYKDRNFKKSSEKCGKELEFVTTNLHVQRLRVIEKNEEFCYDVITFGTPSAHSLKFRHGGLKRLLDDDSSPNESLSATENEILLSATNALRIKNVLKAIQKEVMEQLDDIESLDNEGLKKAADFLSNKVADVLHLASSSFVQEAEEQLALARPSRSSKGSDIEPQGEYGWVWDDDQYQMKALTEIDRENTDCGLRDELAKFMSIINGLTSTASNEDGAINLKRASETLSRSLSSFIKKICVVMRFILIKKSSSFSTCTKDVQYRRDVVFAQVLPSVIAGFAVKLSENLQNQVFLHQILKIGVLVNFESLITAYGDELGMLEDAVVAYKDLKRASFVFVCNNSWSCFPSLEGNRQNLIVYIPLHEEHFSKLPEELRSGHRIAIYPVLFNVGINEHATIAERFGDMSVQDRINTENMNNLFTYYEKFSSYFPEWVGTKSGCHTSLAMLMVHLQVVVSSKKSKNVDIFRICEEVCQWMNGVRLTTCKSAKDRTAMAVTLEGARILQREHRLPPDLFVKTLNTMRSQGTRLVNSFKNVGIPKYAFNKMQVRAYPNLYRAPEGTYGKNLQT